MSISQALSASKTAPAASRTAGFVLGAKWQPPEPPAPPAAMGHPPEQAADIFQGIITHFVDADLRPKLRQSGDHHLRLIEDLGLDSLDMMEIMLRVEDLLQIRASDDQLRHFRTLGEVRQFIDRSARVTAAVLPAS